MCPDRLFPVNARMFARCPLRPEMSRIVAFAMMCLLPFGGAVRAAPCCPALTPQTLRGGRPPYHPPNGPPDGGRMGDGTDRSRGLVRVHAVRHEVRPMCALLDRFDHIAHPVLHSGAIDRSVLFAGVRPVSPVVVADHDVLHAENAGDPQDMC